MELPLSFDCSFTTKQSHTQKNTSKTAKQIPFPLQIQHSRCLLMDLFFYLSNVFQIYLSPVIEYNQGVLQPPWVEREPKTTLLYLLPKGFRKMKSCNEMYCSKFLLSTQHVLSPCCFHFPAWFFWGCWRFKSNDLNQWQDSLLRNVYSVT